MARVVRPGAQTAQWVPMTVLAEDDDWDIAVLRTAADQDWLAPYSPSPVVARLNTSVEPRCEAVGFPESEVQHTLADALVSATRQTEQVSGTLSPAGQGKRPVTSRRKLPQRWMPLDAKGPTPPNEVGWGGMSGAGVVLPDGRLAGLVVGAETGHQRRRLYVVPIAEVLDLSPRIAMGLADILNDLAIAEVRDAPLYREILRDECLNPDGIPKMVRVAGLGAFGVKAAGIPEEPAFLKYVPRDSDQDLRDKLLRAQSQARMLLVVGGSAGGKSRSAATAVPRSFGGLNHDSWRVLRCDHERRGGRGKVTKLR